MDGGKLDLVQSRYKYLAKHLIALNMAACEAFGSRNNIIRALYNLREFIVLSI